MWHEDVRPVEMSVGRLADVAQAGGLADLSERSIHKLIRRGELEGVRIGHRWYVTRKSLLDYCARTGRV